MKKNYSTIYLTRHGETEWNEKKIIQGHSDIPFDAVFSSDLVRAKKSAEIIIKGKKLTIITTKLLRERIFGRFEGGSLTELRKTLGETMVFPKEKQKKLKLNDLENDEEIITRLIPFMKKTIRNYRGKNILMVTHGGLLRAFLSYINYKIPKYSDRPMKNTGYLIIESDGEEFKLKEERLFWK